LISFEDFRTARRREFERADVVLHGDRHAVQDTGRPRGLSLREQRFAEILGGREQRIEALRFD